MNRLYYGDCLTIMANEMKSNSVDLIYLDPPFNSNRNYNAIYKDETGRPLPEQMDAFCDIWTLDEETNRALRDVPEFMLREGFDHNVVQFWQIWMDALRRTNEKLLAYLSYMTERLLQMRIILKPKGSIYLHCDPTASHYIKVIMDSIFGDKNFRAEIIWKRHNAHNDKLYGTIHDTIFYYSFGEKSIPKEVLIPLTDDRIEDYDGCDEHGKYESRDLKGSGSSKGESGQPWRDVDPGHRHWAPPRVGSPGRYAEYIVENFIPNYGEIVGVHARLDALNKAGLIIWPEKGKVPRLKHYLTPDAGMPPQSIWDDIGKASGDEDEGYDTQKPVALLDRIIKASSKKGETVFDPFCGCGTTLEASQNLERKWIGIDIAIHAIKRVSAVRLKHRCGLVEGKDYEITGVPLTAEGAKDLWARDPYHFQTWAIEEVDGFVKAGRGADGGVDGRLYFYDSQDDLLKAMVIQVKGGEKVNPESLRAVVGTLSEDLPLGGFITRKTLGTRQKQNFLKTCREQGTVEINGVSYPRLQILSVEEILNGDRFKTPVVRGRATTDQLKLDLSTE